MGSAIDHSLPIEAIRERLEDALSRRPVVITAPTGTGKSTQVPRWLFNAPTTTAETPLLVVQPRRVAARAVAARIAEQEEIRLGEEVGYRVRDDDCSSSKTKLLVVTPGIVLAHPEILSRGSIVILDELHERRLDTDIIFSLLARGDASFIAMSATMDGDEVARAVDGEHLSVKTRNYPVTIEHFDSSPDLPTERKLEGRVFDALSQLPSQEGDVLVFLPGKGEIERVSERLVGQKFHVLPLHGSLTLQQQALALRPSGQRRIILSTNVAETSLTIPSVRVVIDSGLVRRTRYHHGRTYLSLAHIALDSADQRTGRAGRTAPGHCIRLWGKQARLHPTTPPEIHREELAPLVMTCARIQVAPARLPFLDPPKDYALEDSRQRLTQLGVLEYDAAQQCDVLTPTGEQLSNLPLDPWLSRILIEAKKTGCLDDAIDLVAALEQPNASALSRQAPEEELEHRACDAEALVFIMREGQVSGPTGRRLKEGRTTARRLRKTLGLSGSPPRGGIEDRTRLLKTLLQADPVCAHVARTRKRRTVFSNGGTEMAVGRESRCNPLLSSSNPDDQVDALLVLETHGSASGANHQLLITLASPIPLSWLAEKELGSVTAKQPKVAKNGPLKGRIVVNLERTYAGRLLESVETQPTGPHARTAIASLLSQGQLHPNTYREAQKRIARRSLAHALGQNPKFSDFRSCAAPPPLAEWLESHLEKMGVEHCDDLDLLSEDDFLPEEVPAELAPQLDDQFPLEVDMGDCLYAVEYQLEKRQATLSIIRGARKTPPPPSYLPRFAGLKVFVEAGGSFHQVRR